MKLKRTLSLLLSLALMLGLLSGCGSGTNPTTEPDESPKQLSAREQGEPRPDDEYERAIWYGFLPEDLAEADPENTVLTWSQYCNMLGSAIKLHDEGEYSAWQKMTKAAPNTEMKRDGAMVSLLFAAKTMGLASFNANSPAEFNDYAPKVWDVVTMDYPVFNWNTPIDLGDGCSDNNHVGPAYDFCLRRVSFESNKSLLEFDEAGDLRLEQPLTLREAALSVVRLYESELSSDFNDAAYVTASEVEAVYAAADQRRDAILNSPTTIVKADEYIMGESYSGTAYYVSNRGSDRNNGLSPETPFATMAPFDNIQLNYGDAVFFERGSIWRATDLHWKISETAGMTISAYGEGPKPAFYGSEENGTGGEKWELFYSDDTGKKIWKFYREMTEVASIVLNESEFVLRDVAYWDGESYLQLDDRHEALTGEDYDITQHLPDMWCFPALDYPDMKTENLGDALFRAWDENGKEVFYTGSLFFRCDAGNPGEIYENIEFIMPHAFCDGMADDQTYDNLCVLYSSITSCSGFHDGYGAQNGVVQNCEFGWKGGHVFSYATGEETGDTRIQLNAGLFGRNSGAFAINSSHYTVRNNYIHDAFQEGIALETFIGRESMQDCVVSGNLIERTTQGILLCNWDMEVNPDHIFKNTVVEDNLVLDSGVNNFFSTDWEDDYCNAVVIQGGPCANENLVIRNNTFAFATGALVQIDQFSKEYSRVFEGNTYIQYAAESDVIGARGVGINYSMYNHLTPESIATFLGDETGIAKLQE
ncbi:MAG: right-handed parallel beta-helix repeat-containing protein [Oscillospiraceae bacterium]|nr:right-handed parallel beta-helix repeat-containing protein [Oscillospiraceae bacterium]